MYQQPKTKKSIGQRIRKVHTSEHKLKVCAEWADEWQKDQVATINLIHNAVIHGRREDTKQLLSQLMAITDKRFVGLNTVFNVILSDDSDDHHGQLDTAAASVVEQHDPEPPAAQSSPAPVSKPDMTADIVRAYKDGKPIKEIANYRGVNDHKIVKILVTAGVYQSDMYSQICKLRDKGLTNQEICDRLNIKASTISDYTPYKKGIYNLDNASDNAKHLRSWRKSKDY